MKLRGVRESQLRGLLSHRSADLGNAVADVHDGCLACRVEELAPVRGKEPAAFATDGDRNRLLKVARKQSGVV